MNTPAQLVQFFRVPLFVLSGIVGYVLLNTFLPDLTWARVVLALVVIAVGSYDLVAETIDSIRHKQFALDYIAILAIAVGVATQQYLVALVIVLMLSGGSTLEDYGMARAKASLTALTDRIPNDVVLWNGGKADKRKDIEAVAIGEEVMVRKGEVVPLDGVLVSDEALIDESSLTGEAYTVEKATGDHVHSGTVNMGNVLVIRVTKTDHDSTYRKIVELVKQAQAEKSPFIRLADRYSTVFTIITLAIAAIAYGISGDVERVLAVLVVATPCPLILATPIALFGGMNAAAKHRILIKKVASLEVLSRVNAVAFDKTGTITLGRPTVSSVVVLNPVKTVDEIYSIAEAIERNSLHPLAKAIVAAAHERHVPRLMVEDVEEHVGSGISAVIHGTRYALTKMKTVEDHNTIELLENDQPIARFVFDERLKNDSKKILSILKELGLTLSIFTGDKEINARKLIDQLGDIGQAITIYADCTPADKKQGIERLRQSGKVVAMVGDGINDAPGLAMADVGMVFSHEEHTAASEAADIIFLGGDVSAVTSVIDLAKRTIRIALQSIWFGIGLSIIAMIVAMLGYLPPLYGAFLQEFIDIVVIFNALRTSRLWVSAD